MKSLVLAILLLIPLPVWAAALGCDGEGHYTICLTETEVHNISRMSPIYRCLIEHELDHVYYMHEKEDSGCEGVPPLPILLMLHPAERKYMECRAYQAQYYCLVREGSIDDASRAAQYARLRYGCNPSVNYEEMSLQEWVNKHPRDAAPAHAGGGGGSMHTPRFYCAPLEKRIPKNKIPWIDSEDSPVGAGDKEDVQ